MRLVLDTNAVISGLLWSGPPRQLLDAAIRGTIEIFTSSILLAELREALAYPRLAQRRSETGSSIDLTVDRYLAIAHLTAPAAIAPTVLGDPDDDHVLACALSAEADLIVTRDTLLLNLKHFHRIQIVNATEAMRRVEQQNNG